MKWERERTKLSEVRLGALQRRCSCPVVPAGVAGAVVLQAFHDLPPDQRLRGAGLRGAGPVLPGRRQQPGSVHAAEHEEERGGKIPASASPGSAEAPRLSGFSAARLRLVEWRTPWGQKLK